MALLTYEIYEILSDGMFAGTVKEPSLTDTERYLRILSHGLIGTAPGPPEGGLFNHLLAVGRGGIKALQGFFRVG